MVTAFELLEFPLPSFTNVAEVRFSEEVRRSRGVEGAPGLVVHYHRR
jgi:hypothetical protein